MNNEYRKADAVFAPEFIKNLSGRTIQSGDSYTFVLERVVPDGENIVKRSTILPTGGGSGSGGIRYTTIQQQEVLEQQP